MTIYNYSIFLFLSNDYNFFLYFNKIIVGANDTLHQFRSHSIKTNVR